MDFWQIDLVQMDKSSDGHNYILTIVDMFTSFAITRPLKTKTATEVASQLYDVICLFGPPRLLHSDEGKEFANDVIKELTKLFSIDFRLSTPHAHHSRGTVERTNRTLEEILRKSFDGASSEWHHLLGSATLFYNISIRRTSKSSPYSLLFTRSWNRNDKSEFLDHTFTRDLEAWRMHQRNVLDNIYPAVFVNIDASKAKSVADFHNRHPATPELVHGQHVMMRDQTKTSKQDPTFIGPYIVQRRLDTGSYLISMQLDNRTISLQRDRSQLKPVPPPKHDKPSYFVERIIQHKGSQLSTAQYLVKWLGYSAADNSWLSAADFVDLKTVRAYWNSTVAPAAAPKQVPPKRKRPTPDATTSQPKRRR